MAEARGASDWWGWEGGPGMREAGALKKGFLPRSAERMRERERELGGGGERGSCRKWRFNVCVN